MIVYVQMKGDAAGGVTSLHCSAIRGGLVGKQDEPMAKETAAPAPPCRSGLQDSGLGLKQALGVSNANGGPFQGWKLRERGMGRPRGREADRSRRLCLCVCS